MQSIKKVTIEGFRGIRHTLTLEPEGRSLLILAENSRGKSSIADAMEWFFCKEHVIEHLRSESTSERDYQHLLVNDEEGASSVSVEFRGTDPALTKTINTSESLTTNESDPTRFSALSKEFVVPPCLRFIDVAKFVLETKGKKYEILARWMGFEDLMQEQLRLRDAREVVNLYIKNLDRDIKLRKERMKQAAALPGTTDSHLLGHANRLLEDVDSSTVATREELRAKVQELQRKQLDVRAEREHRLASAEEEAAALLFQDHAAETAAVVSEGQAIATAIATNPRSRIDSLYQSGLSVLVDETVKLEACPLCDTPWHQTTRAGRSALVAHIRGEIAKMESMKIRRNTHQQSLVVLLDKLESERAAANDLDAALVSASAPMGYSYIPVHRAAVAYCDAIAGFVVLLRTNKWTEAQKISLASFQKAAEAGRVELADLIKQERAKSSLTPQEKKISESLAKLEAVSRQWDELQDAMDKYAFAKREAEKFEGICDVVDSTLQESVQKGFDAVSSLIQRYFEILRPPTDPHNRISDIQLKLHRAGKAAGRSVEVEFTYHSRIGVTPPKRVMTESHLNALGLSIYLALAHELNVTTRFLLLDDAINSLDMAHRHNFAKLLADEFGEWQLFVFTHDDICFESLTELLSSAQKKKLVRWSFDDGPELDAFSSTLDKVQQHLDKGDPTEAMRALGRHIERTLNILCENMNARTRHCYFKRPSHTIGELFPALQSCCKELKCEQSLLDHFTNMKIAGKLRNHSAHDMESLSSGVSSPEVEAYRDEWAAFESAFFCVGCERFAHRPPWEDYLACKCGAKRIPAAPIVSPATSPANAVTVPTPVSAEAE